MPDKIVAIIQTRMRSNRLPNKMMLLLHGHPIIEWVLKRVRGAKLLDDVIVAIPDTWENDLLAKYLVKLQAHVYRGSKDDVLKPIYEASCQ